ncbi:CDP-glycerol glycerophosphotransferase family protein, partial [Nocardioides sp.]|uniref:CDP-glycerol glycerophosphotransferase family protein n=1 Tax=Nocardioides sp. TaxID=35761 RepID=UPI002ED82940
MRNLALAVVLGSLRLVLRVLSRVVPTTDSVVLAVYPETEGNGLEVARALVRRYRGRVVWLRDSGPLPAEVAELAAAHGLVLVPKASLRGLWAYLRAEAVLFTHGLYGSPRPCARKPVVNLWHGDGPKDIRPGRDVGALIASTYLVGSTPLFSHWQGEAFGVPRERVLVTGNPRTDQFWRPPGADRLARLGITGDFVVWMPTFRQARAVGAVRVRGGAAADPDGQAELGVLLERLLAGLGERGIQLVVKPHPMDSDRRRWPGAITVDEDDLVRAGVTLYGLLGASSGLVTDYSSVWVDYLLLDRPLAFLVPDRSSYSRSLHPADILDWVPGEVVDAADRPFERFLAELDTDGGGSPDRRAVAARIGLNPSTTSADDLVTELVKRGVLSS